MCLGGFLYPAVDVAALVVQGAFLSRRQAERVYKTTQLWTGAANRARNFSRTYGRPRNKRAAKRQGLPGPACRGAGRRRTIPGVDARRERRLGAQCTRQRGRRRAPAWNYRKDEAGGCARCRSARQSSRLICKLHLALVRTLMSAVTRRWRSSRRWLRAIPYSASSRIESPAIAVKSIVYRIAVRRS